MQDPQGKAAFEEVMEDKSLKTTVSRRLGGQREKGPNREMQCVSQFCV